MDVQGQEPDAESGRQPADENRVKVRNGGKAPLSTLLAGMQLSTKLQQ